MKPVLRMIPAVAFFAAGLSAPALAQNADAPAPTITVPAPATSPADTVGPAQLRNFSLQGTVTRKADTPATPEPRPAPARSAAATAPAPTGNATAPTPASAAPQRSPAFNAQRQVPAPAATATPAASAFNFPPPTPAQEPTGGFGATTSPLPVSTPAGTPIETAGAGFEGGMLSYWPWLVALLAAAGAAIWYFRRPRSGYALAGGGADASAFDLQPAAAPPVRPAPPKPQPAPSAPPRAMPEPAPRAPAPVTGGVVSSRLRASPDVQTLARAPTSAPPASAPAPATPGLVSSRLRPWLELEFTPLNAVLDEAKAVIEFQLTVFNSGSAPARDVLVEARLFNAGDDQDQAIADFFGNRVAEGDAIPLIAPLQRMEFRTTASILRSQMRIFEAGGRQVFVPLIGFNAMYRWSSGQGQSSTSYILGRSTSGDKMAPFLIGDGAKTFRGLGAREHTLRIRK